MRCVFESTLGHFHLSHHYQRAIWPSLASHYPVVQGRGLKTEHFIPWAFRGVFFHVFTAGIILYPFRCALFLPGIIFPHAFRCALCTPGITLITSLYK